MRPFNVRYRQQPRSRRGERGQAAVLFALMLVALLGVTGLVVDGSNTQENHRQMQNAADAAAIAGAFTLPATDTTQAATDAKQWLTKNAASVSEASVSFSTTTSTNDTIGVTLARTVPFKISQILGLSPTTITTTAKAQAKGKPANRMDMTAVNADSSLLCSGYNICPYAVWAFNPDAAETPHVVGDIVTFRSNSWIGTNVYSHSKYWTGNSNSFKGYLRPAGPFVDVGTQITDSAGGNACGQEPVAQLQAAYNSHQPIVLPVYDGESGNGYSDLHLAGFVMLNINIAGSLIPNGCPSDFQGQIISFMAVPNSTLTYNSSITTSFVDCGTGIGICRNYPGLTQ